MKTIPVCLLSLSLPVLAGTTEYVAPAPAPDPCVFTWFTGGSVGYLTEFEEPMYHLHLGTDTCWNLGGWGVAFFAEIGYTEKDDSWWGQRRNINGLETALDIPNGNGMEFGGSFTGDLGELESLLSYAARNSPYNTGYDLDIMPITLNVKLERPLTDGLNFYFGGGLGMALVDLSVDVGPMSFSDDDWVFVGQLFTGLNYNFNPDFEVYGGVRWIYYDDADFSDSGSTVTLELEDDFLFEIGARFNF